jgi:hypothetical protein
MARKRLPDAWPASRAIVTAAEVLALLASSAGCAELGAARSRRLVIRITGSDHHRRDAPQSRAASWRRFVS